MAEVYEMLMKIGLHGGILADLTLVAERLTRIHRLSEQIATGFSRWHLALVGIGSLLGGTAIIGGAVKLAESAKGWSEALIKAQQTGPELRAMVKSGELQSKAFDIQKRVGMNVEDLISIPTTLYSVTGKDEALKLWEPMARYSTLGLKDKSAEDKESALKALVRAGELTGRFVDNEGNFDAKKANEFLDLMVKIKNATHGMVNEQTMLAFAMRAGTSARGLTDKGFMMEAIQMQAMGGHQAGTSLMSLWQQMAGGTMFNRTAKGMEELGLLKPEEWTSKGGRVIISDAASKRLTRLIGKDPTDLVTAIINAFEEKGITDPEDRQRLIMRMLNRQTTQRMMSEMVVNRRQQRAERERMAGGMGADDSFKLREDESIDYNMRRMTSAWHNLQIAVAGPNSENFIKVLKELTGIFHSMTDYVRGMDPKQIADIGKGIATLGIALGAGGIAAIALALGPYGWLVGGLAAMAYWLSKPEFRSGMEKLSEWFAKKVDDLTSSLSGRLESASEKFGKNIDSLPQMLSNWLSSDTISKWISDNWNSIANKIVPWLDNNLFNPISEWLSSHSIASAISNWFDINIWQPLNNLNPFKGKAPSSFDGDSLIPGMTAPINFNPSNNRQILQPVTITLNLDGRTMGQAMSEILEDLYTHPTGPPQANGWDHFRPQGSFSDT